MTYKNVPAEKLRWGQVALLVLACAWGTDYLITPKWALGPALSVVEAALPIPAWGGLFLAFGVMGLVGELWIEMGRFKPPPQHPIPVLCRAENRWWPSYTAHTFLCALYATVGVGYLLNLITAWHFWGFRSSIMMWMLAYCHFIFINRRGGNHVS